MPALVRILRKPALLALVYGTVAAMAATSRVDVRLVASTTVTWCFVPLMQVLIAWAIVARTPARVAPVSDTLDAFFATSLPWAVCLLIFAAWSAAGPAVGRTLTVWHLSIVVAALWTPWLVVAFCRDTLRLDLRSALIRTTIHQATSWALFLAWYGTAVGLWPRVIGWVKHGSITL
jgi:hypothetical protein